jgi:hypothetical protein
LHISPQTDDLSFNFTQVQAGHVTLKAPSSPAGTSIADRS